MNLTSNYPANIQEEGTNLFAYSLYALPIYASASRFLYYYCYKPPVVPHIELGMPQSILHGTVHYDFNREIACTSFGKVDSLGSP